MPSPSRTEAAPPALQVRRLALRTAEGFSLEVADCQVPAGARWALTGRNGCGKSTFIEALCGLRRTEAAQGELLGQPLTALHNGTALRRRVGVLLQQVEFSAFAKVGELVRLHEAMYGTRWAALHQALGLAELEPLRARTLSRGQRQRMQLYLALAHRPELALLDEPLTGLDRRYADTVSACLNSRELAHCTMLIVGHTPQELALCSQLLWLHEGRLVDRGDGDALIGRHLGRWRARVRLPAAGVASSALDELQAALKVPGLRRLDRPDASTLIVFSDRSLDAELARHAPPGGWDALELGHSAWSDLLQQGPAQDPAAKVLH